MSQESLYSSEDKTRLLQELEKATSTGNRIPALQNSQHADELHELFGQVVGLPKEEPVAEVPKEAIVKMTHGDLRALKGASNKVKVSGGSGPSLMQSIVMFICSIKDAFTATTSKGAENCEKKRASGLQKKRD